MAETLIIQGGERQETHISTERYYALLQQVAEQRPGHFLMPPYIGGASDKAIDHLLKRRFSEFKNRVPLESRHRDPQMLLQEAQMPWTEEYALTSDQALAIAAIFKSLSPTDVMNYKTIMSTQKGVAIGAMGSSMPFYGMIDDNDRYMVAQLMGTDGVPRDTFVYHLAPFVKNNPALQAYRVGKDLPLDPQLLYASDLDPAGQNVDLPRLNILPMCLSLTHKAGMEIKFPYEPASPAETQEQALMMEGRVGIWSAVKKPSIYETLLQMFPNQHKMARFVELAHRHKLLQMLIPETDKFAEFIKKFPSEAWFSPEAQKMFTPIVLFDGRIPITLLNAGQALAAPRLTPRARALVRQSLGVTMASLQTISLAMRKRVTFEVTPHTGETRNLGVQDLLHWQHALTHQPPGFHEMIAYAGATDAFNDQYHPLHMQAQEICRPSTTIYSPFALPSRRMATEYLPLFERQHLVNTQVKALTDLGIETDSQIGKEILAAADVSEVFAILRKHELENLRRTLTEEFEAHRLSATPLLESRPPEPPQPEVAPVPMLEASAPAAPAEAPPAPAPAPERKFSSLREVVTYIQTTVMADKQFVPYMEALRTRRAQLDRGEIYTAIPASLYRESPDNTSDHGFDIRELHQLVNSGRAFVIVRTNDAQEHNAGDYWQELRRNGNPILGPSGINEMELRMREAGIPIPDWFPAPEVEVEEVEEAAREVAAPTPVPRPPEPTQPPPRAERPEQAPPAPEVLIDDEEIINEILRIVRRIPIDYRNVLKNPVFIEQLKKKAGYTVIPSDAFFTDEMAERSGHLITQEQRKLLLEYATTRAKCAFIVVNPDDFEHDKKMWYQLQGSGHIVVLPSLSAELAGEIQTMYPGRTIAWIEEYINTEEEASPPPPPAQPKPKAAPLPPAQAPRPREMQPPSRLEGQALVNHIINRIIQRRRTIAGAYALEDSNFRALINREAYTVINSRSFLSPEDGGATDEELDMIEQLIEREVAFVLVTEEHYDLSSDYWTKRIAQGQALLNNSRESQAIIRLIQQRDDEVHGPPAQKPPAASTQRPKSHSVEAPPNIPPRGQQPAAKPPGLLGRLLRRGK